MKKNKKNTAINMKKILRDLMIEQNAFDGRMSERVVTMKKHKKPKHKHRIFEETF